MGCVISNNLKGITENKDCGSYVWAILKDKEFAKSFMIFVSNGWRVGSAYDEVLTGVLRNRAINSLEFLYCAADFVNIPQSDFAHYRAQHIYLNYIGCGAAKDVKLSRNTVDECAKKVLETYTADNGIGVFEGAVAEVLEFLEVEVYAEFAFAFPGVKCRNFGFSFDEMKVKYNGAFDLIEREGTFSTAMPNSSILCDNCNARAHGRQDLLCGDCTCNHCSLFAVILDPSNKIYDHFTSFVRSSEAISILRTYEYVIANIASLRTIFCSEDTEFRVCSALHFLHELYDKFLFERVDDDICSQILLRELFLSTFATRNIEGYCEEVDDDPAETCSLDSVGEAACSDGEVDLYLTAEAKQLTLIKIAAEVVNDIESKSDVVGEDSSRNNAQRCYMCGVASTWSTRKCTGRSAYVAYTFKKGYETFLSRMKAVIAHTLIDPFLLSMENYTYCSNAYSSCCSDVSKSKYLTAVLKKFRFTSPLSGFPEFCAGDSMFIPSNSICYYERLRLFCRAFQTGRYWKNLNMFRRCMDEMNQNILSFCFEVFLLKSNQYIDDLQVVSQIQKICETFLVPNCRSPIILPTFLKDVILSHRNQNNLFVFDAAISWVMEKCLHSFWCYLVKNRFFVSIDSDGKVMQSNPISEASIVSLPFCPHDVSYDDYCPEVQEPLKCTGKRKYSASCTSSELFTSIQEHCNAFFRRRSSGGAVIHPVKSLDIRMIVNNSSACAYFKKFLGGYGIAHYLTFISEVEDCRSISNFLAHGGQFKKIYYRYIHLNSVLNIPIDESLRLAVFEEIKRGTYRICMLQSVCEGVIQILETGAFERFKRIPDIVRQAEHLISLDLQASFNHDAGYFHQGCSMLGTSSLIEYNSDARCTFHDALSLCSRNVRVAQLALTFSNLQSILRYQSTTRFFKDFCVSRLCAENLYFWLDAENFRTIAEKTSRLSHNYLRRLAVKIFCKYISTEAKLQVNISSGQIEFITHSLRHGKELCYIFEKAKLEVYGLLSTGVFMQFLNSKEFQCMILALSDTKE